MASIAVMKGQHIFYILIEKSFHLFQPSVSKKHCSPKKSELEFLVGFFGEEAEGVETGK